MSGWTVERAVVLLILVIILIVILRAVHVL
jgi:hypothetical protein